MTAVWIGGSFDPIHAGHVALFAKAGEIARTRGVPWVTVAVNSDEFIGRFKPKPVQPLHDRMAVVAGMRHVNEVQVNDGTDQAGLIVQSDARVILVGDDWAPPRDYLGQLGVTQEWLDRYQIQVHYIRRIGGLSSSRLKQQIRAAAVRS